MARDALPNELRPAGYTASLDVAHPDCRAAPRYPVRVDSACPSASLPGGAAVEADWRALAIEQTGRLPANGRTAEVLEVVTSGEARDAASVRAA